MNSVNCPQCGLLLAIGPEVAGMRVACPCCSAEFPLPPEVPAIVARPAVRPVAPPSARRRLAIPAVASCAVLGGLAFGSMCYPPVGGQTRQAPEGPVQESRRNPLLRPTTKDEAMKDVVREYLRNNLDDPKFTEIEWRIGVFRFASDQSQRNWVGLKYRTPNGTGGTVLRHGIFQVTNGEVSYIFERYSIGYVDIKQ